MTLRIYQIDAFTDELFKGNPAAVIPLEEWLPDQLMQLIALENNLSETVFFVPVGGKPVINVSPDPLVIDNLVTEEASQYDIRWFTPQVEINLCGHATLAAAYVLFDILQFNKSEIVFNSKSGPLYVTKDGDRIMMDFPAWPPTFVDSIPDRLQEALGMADIKAVYKNRDLLVELNSEEAVAECRPNFNVMKEKFDKLIITAASAKVDFVSRFFAPGAGINEDPVTGSAHSQLIPFWSERLGKRQMVAMQLSERSGRLWCEHNGDRVMIGGNARHFMTGEIFI